MSDLKSGYPTPSFTRLRHWAFVIRHFATASPLFLLADQAPVFFHQVNVGCGKARRNVDSSIRNALVDLELGNESAIDENKEETAAALNAQSIEHHAPMIIELKQRAIGSIVGCVRRKRHDISLRHPRHLFDCHLSTGNLRAHRCGENLGVSRIRLDMHSESAMRLFRNAYYRRPKQAKSK